jgi:DNA-binding NarL/FixJ family response regulator
MYGSGMLALAHAAPWVAAAILLLGFLFFAMGMRPPKEIDNDEVKSLVVIDDDSLVRHGLRSLVEARTPFRVKAETGSGPEGVRIVGELRPDLVVVDVMLPEMDGIEVTKRIKEIDPTIPVVSFSSIDDDPTGAIMRRAGASAHLVKGDTPEEIIQTLMDFS